MKSITVNTLLSYKSEGKKFSCLTAYDATFARLISLAGVETILVGDSLGMVLQGHDSTLPVSSNDIAYHTAAVSKGNQGSLIIADMPFMSYAETNQALLNARQLMQAGAHMIKMEGGEWLAETINKLVRCGIPVCGHLGLTPQSVNTLGGYKVQGRAAQSAQQIEKDALVLQNAGAQLLVLECVPRQLAKTITENVDIPVIGIGAGPDTNAQVLVLHDMLGLNPKPARFVKDFMAENHSIPKALQAYSDEVQQGVFPGDAHCFE